MASTTKKGSKSVTFTTDDADQELLKEVESVIEGGQYASFSDLCKDALEQFLFPDAPQVGGETTDASRLEQLLMQVQTQLASLPQIPSEHGGSQFSVNQLSQLENQLLHLAQQIEQLDESTRQIPDQIQQQYESLESLVSGQSSGGDGSQFESQLTRLSQQLKQIDTKTSQTLGQVQNQLTALEEGLSGQSGLAEGPVMGDQLENQLAELADQVEKMSTKTGRAIKELQQQIMDLNLVAPDSDNAAEAFSAEELTVQLDSHVTNLTERINWVDAKSEERLMQLQRQLTELMQTLTVQGSQGLSKDELMQTLAVHESQYLSKVEEQFAELLEKVESMDATKVVTELVVQPEVEEAKPASTKSMSSDPLLSRLSSLIEDF